MTVVQQESTATWHAPEGIAVRGTLVLLPGRGESPQVYERFGRRLSADAYEVHALRAPSDSPADTREHLDAVLAAADPGVPRVVVGSDAGAAYAVHLAAAAELPGVSALVLAGLPTAGAGAPGGGWEAELDLRTSCPTHRRRISGAGVRPAALYDDLPEEWLDPGSAGRLQLPVLGLHGRDDVVSPLEDAARWYAAVDRAELVGIAGGRHDVLNDQTHRTVAATVVLFLERLRAGADLAPIATVEGA